MLEKLIRLQGYQFSSNIWVSIFCISWEISRFSCRLWLLWLCSCWGRFLTKTPKSFSDKAEAGVCSPIVTSERYRVWRDWHHKPSKWRTQALHAIPRTTQGGGEEPSSSSNLLRWCVLWREFLSCFRYFYLISINKYQQFHLRW